MRPRISEITLGVADPNDHLWEIVWNPANIPTDG
jgi:hypothetical protein